MSTFLKAFLTVVTLTVLVACGVQPDGQRNDEQNAFSRSAVSQSILPGAGAAPETGCSCEEINAGLNDVLDGGQVASFGPGRGFEHLTMCNGVTPDYLEKVHANAAAANSAAAQAERQAIEAAKALQRNCSQLESERFRLAMEEFARRRVAAATTNTSCEAVIRRFAGACANHGLKVAAFCLKRAFPFADVLLSANTCHGSEIDRSKHLHCGNVDEFIDEEGKKLLALTKQSVQAQESLTKLKKEFSRLEKLPRHPRMGSPLPKKQREISEMEYHLSKLKYAIRQSTEHIAYLESYRAKCREREIKTPTPTMTPTPAPSRIELPIPPKTTVLSSAS